MKTHRVWLPFPPSVNGLFAHGSVKNKRTGKTCIRRFASKPYKAWQRQAWVYIKSARMPRIEGPVRVRIYLTPPSSARRDVDNYCKAILDALVENRVLVDDSQVHTLMSEWDHAAEKPGAVVEILPAKVAPRPALTSEERATLKELRRSGPQLVGPSDRAHALKALKEKGYVKEIPGLIEGVPQGYAVAD